MASPRKKDKYKDITKGGRKPKKIDFKKIERLGRECLTDREIHSSLGIGKSTFYQWLKDYPEIRDRILKGRGKGTSEVVGELLKMSLDKTGDIQPKDKISAIKGYLDQKDKSYRMMHDLELAPAEIKEDDIPEDIGREDLMALYRDEVRGV